MTPNRLLKTAILPAFSELASLGVNDSKEARRFVLAIALQESALSNRRQVVGGAENGPATSFWQFEKMGGCHGVLTHKSVCKIMEKICQDYNVLPVPSMLWEAIRYNDIVAACAARLLVYTLPHALPKTAEVGWEQYVEAWRPGKPHQETWSANWHIADDTVENML